MHPSHHHQLQPYGTGTNSAHSSPLKRVPPPAVSPLASPMESRRLFAPPASAQPSVSSSADHSMLNAIQLGYTLAGPAQPAKLLVDPQTGQQYFVPATQPMSYFAAPAPLFYPNQFYSTPAQTVATAQSHSGFMFTNQPPTTLWSPQQLNSANPPSHLRQRAQSPSSTVSSVPAPCSTTAGGTNHHQSYASAYHVEVPLSNVGSVCEETEFVQYQQHQQQSFQRQHQIRNSTDSRGSIRSSEEKEAHGNQRDPTSTDRFLPPCHSQPAHPRKLLQLQPDHHSTGGSSSESTSGFASGRDRIRTEEVFDGRSPPQSPLIRKERAQFPLIQDERADSCRSDSPKSPSFSKPLPQRMKAIRMDIDLNRPISPPEREQQVSVRTTVLRTAPPTAFTISFNNSSQRTTAVAPLSDPPFESSGDTHELSLQEAARQAPTGRRLMATLPNVPQRNSPKCERMGTDSGSEAGDPKKWLFRKMMIGRDQRIKDMEEREGHREESGDDVDDIISETGTYVVENKKKSQFRTMKNNSVCPRGGKSGNSAPPSTCSPSSSNASSSSRTSSPNVADGEIAAVAKRSLMSDLRRLREQKKNSTVHPPKSKAFTTRVSSASQQISAGQSRPGRQPMPSLNSAKRTENTSFRPKPIGGVANRCRSEPRNDGGRFSMRGTPKHQTKGQPKTTGASVAKDAGQQQSPEMVAWLRRKEYDPRRAAAAADQSQREAQQRQQQDSFMACRSFSSSANAKSPFAQWRQRHKAHNPVAMGDQRNNFSHDDLSRFGESMDDESLSGVAGDSCSNSLQRTVDELTQKCHKSIELLRLCNQSGLSSSVEQLLEKVVEGSGGEVGEHFGTADDESVEKAKNENISDRLERLSSAFDAIQKYLEEQTSMSSSRISLSALQGKMATTDDLQKTNVQK